MRFGFEPQLELCLELEHLFSGISSTCELKNSRKSEKAKNEINCVFVCLFVCLFVLFVCLLACLIRKLWFWSHVEVIYCIFSCSQLTGVQHDESFSFSAFPGGFSHGV